MMITNDQKSYRLMSSVGRSLAILEKESVDQLLLGLGGVKIPVGKGPVTISRDISSLLIRKRFNI
jgi:hypothetical protein